MELTIVKYNIMETDYCSLGKGADILAHSDDNQKYKVFIPDWFEGKPCPIEM